MSDSVAARIGESMTQILGADLIVRHPKSTLFTLPAYRITGVARELFIHLDCVSADMGYLQALGKALRADSYDFRLHKAA